MWDFVPLHDRVLVRRVDHEERTPAGILIPDTAKEKPNEGEVLAVGPGARNAQGIVQPPSVGIGDRVVSAKRQVRRSSSTARTAWCLAKARYLGS